jgi:type I restriction enzyme M protein
MEACIVVCNRHKRKARKGKVLFIDALNEVTRERAQSYLKPEHQERILKAFQAFVDESGFARVATLAEIQVNASSLSIPLYVKRTTASLAKTVDGDPPTLQTVWEQWQDEGRSFWLQMDALVETLDGIVNQETDHA